MIKPGYIGTIGNGEELKARPRYEVYFLVDKRGKIVDVEYLQDYQAPEWSFHVLSVDRATLDTAESAIRYDQGDALCAGANLADRVCAISPESKSYARVIVKPIFRQYA